MEKLYVIVILAILTNEALGMSYRYKRQAEDEGDLEDRYGWNRPIWSNQGRFPQQPWGPNPNIFPNPRPNPLPGQPQLPGQDQGQTTTTTTSNPNANGVNQDNLRACRRTCPVTSEYNPVCGSNNVSYNNPSRLSCDQACGVNVTLLRMSKCPIENPTPTA